MDYEFTDKVNCGAAALLPQKTVTKEPQVIVYLKPFFFVVLLLREKLNSPQHIQLT